MTRIDRSLKKLKAYQLKKEVNKSLKEDAAEERL
jgi:hypothetical protein